MSTRRRTPRALPAPAPRSSRTGEEQDWRARSACADLDPELFFPDPSDCPDEALAACAGCPVRSDCLSWALTTSQFHGIWGGTTEDERQRWHRRSSTAATGIPTTRDRDDARPAALDFGGEAA